MGFYCDSIQSMQRDLQTFEVVTIILNLWCPRISHEWDQYIIELNRNQGYCLNTLRIWFEGKRLVQQAVQSEVRCCLWPHEMGWDFGDVLIIGIWMSTPKETRLLYQLWTNYKKNERLRLSRRERYESRIPFNVNGYRTWQVYRI